MAQAFGFCRCFIASTAAVAALLLVSPGAAAGLLSFPGPEGSQGFMNLGTASALPTADVNTATIFTVGNLLSTEDSHGFFKDLPEQSFSPITFSVTDPLSLRFGNAEFGSFASSSIAQLSNDPDVGSRSFRVQGWFTKGAFGGTLTPNPALTDFTISFNQNAGTGASISVNATLDFASIQPVPEPTTFALLAMATATAVIVHTRRRFA